MAAVAGASSSLIKVAALSGSLRKGSYNRGLVRAAIELSKGSSVGLQIEYVDISPLPFLNTDLEINGTYPSEVEAFRQKIVAADSILFASPEYNYSVTGHLTAKSDVYSFGVVLLEMLSGKRAVDKNRPSGQHNLVEWAKPYLANKRKIFRVLDTRLEGQYSTDDAYKVANLALRCLSIDSKFRPNMDEVVRTLETENLKHADEGGLKVDEP